MSATPMSDKPALQPAQTPASPLPVPPSGDPAPAAAMAPPAGGPAWFRRLSSVLFIIFCFELGLFLLIYPWTDAWTENSLSVFAPPRLAADWRLLWNNSYFRGGMSRVGLVNIWIAIGEVFRMFSRRTN
ncbi:MAG: hypothetical protein ABUS49_07210 [Acidobacteriota bacterium]